MAQSGAGAREQGETRMVAAQSSSEVLDLPNSLHNTDHIGSALEQKPFKLGGETLTFSSLCVCRSDAAYI